MEPPEIDFNWRFDFDRGPLDDFLEVAIGRLWEMVHR